MSRLRHLTVAKFARFILAGAGATAVQYLVAALLHWGGGWRAAWASGAGFVVGAFVNYALNVRFTFGEAARHGETLPRFAFVAACGCAINMLVVEGGDRLGAPAALSQVTATGVVLVWNFVLNSVWSFGGSAKT